MNNDNTRISRPKISGIGDTFECTRDISKNILSGIYAVSVRGRKSALRSDSSHRCSYLAVGRYGRSRLARSIRSEIVSIQSRWSVRPDATKPDRISGSTTLSYRELIREHNPDDRRCGYREYGVGERVQKRVQNRCSCRKALNEQKSVPARRADRLISVKTLASLKFARYPSLLPRIYVGSWIHRFVRCVQTWRDSRKKNPLSNSVEENKFFSTEKEQLYIFVKLLLLIQSCNFVVMLLLRVLSCDNLWEITCSASEFEVL